MTDVEQRMCACTSFVDVQNDFWKVEKIYLKVLIVVDDVVDVDDYYVVEIVVVVVAAVVVVAFLNVFVMPKEAGFWPVVAHKRSVVREQAAADETAWLAVLHAVVAHANCPVCLVDVDVVVVVVDVATGAARAQSDASVSPRVAVLASVSTRPARVGRSRAWRWCVADDRTQCRCRRETRRAFDVDAVVVLVERHVAVWVQRCIDSVVNERVVVVGDDVVANVAVD